MKNALLFILVSFAVAAGAQDRTITVREVDVAPVRAEVEVLPDAGCALTAFATVSPPSVEPIFVRSRYAFNGARCTSVKNAIVQAAKNDLGVGDGSAP